MLQSFSLAVLTRLEENMSRQSSRKRFEVVLSLLIIAAYLVIAPVSQVQAQGCIEYTVWNEETQRCECPNQECCDFYCPFIPYGCPDKGTAGCPETGEAMAEERTSSSAVLQLLLLEPQAEFSRASWTRRVWQPQLAASRCT